MTFSITRLGSQISLAGFFLVELVMSSIRVAWDVVRPRSRARPGIVAVPLDATSDLQITVLANLISLTPGSLSLDVSDDRKTLYVHLMFVGSVEAERDAIKQDFERRVMEAIP